MTDFLGSRTRIDYLPKLSARTGSVEPYPIPSNFHATSTEWAGALRAVLDARMSLTAVELGAGWGPWLVAAALAARLRGINEIRLVGLEGDKSHWEYMRQHFKDNGLEPDRHTLLNAVVGVRDGSAWFTVFDDPSEYGGVVEAGLAKTGSGGGAVNRLRRWAGKWYKRIRGKAPEGMVRVPCHSLPSILRGLGVVDLVHMDIQGHEVEVISHSRGSLESQVRRLVIGTHGRVIESQLHDVLSARGWVLEAEEACRLAQAGANFHLIWDGCQVWRNRALLPNPTCPG